MTSFRQGGAVVERVSKGDLLAADQEEIDSLSTNQEIELLIEKAAWRRDLAWHFSDGQGSFDAKIEHKDFWSRVEQGEAFAGGDRLRVHLVRTARRMKGGRPKVEHIIPTVV